MTAHEDFSGVVSEIQVKLQPRENGKNNLVLMYSFNGVGKTRLSEATKKALDPEEDADGVIVLSYNAFFEDIFTWDNEKCVLLFDPSNYIIKFIIDQGLENQITDNFQSIVRQKISPNYDLVNGRVTFSFSSGDERTAENIKISRGEESLFISCIFYAVLEAAVIALSAAQENRETDLFNNLKYIIIDDPVSSIDDTKIITMAMELVRMLKSAASCNLNFLITTHHALFFNVLHNEHKEGRSYKFSPYLLSKNSSGYSLELQDDSPFSYHLTVANEIKLAVESGDLKKYHFNLFRVLLEKTANYFGYKGWGGLIGGDDGPEMIRLINLHSHGKLSELESNHFPDEQKILFGEKFAEFIHRFELK